MDDRQLLQDYAARGSEKAFRTLVEGYLGFVYNCARRQVNDSQLAEEVTQAVFILLARKAAKLSRGVVLGGWLFQTTRFVASKAIRSEQRRRKREQEAYAMQQLHSTESANLKLAPLLDEALSCLRERERNAVLLRFNQDQSLREVGAKLGISEEAAKKRVGRALEKMRSFFASHGFTVSVAVLAGVCSQALSAPAPAYFTAGMITNSVAASATGTTTGLVSDTLNAWRWAKIKLAGFTTISACGLLFLSAFAFKQAKPSAQNNFVSPSPSSSPVAETVSNSSAGVQHSTPAISGKERTLQFKLVAKDSGAPISGAQIGVNVVANGEWKARFDQFTDENGVANVVYPAGAGRLDIGAIASGWAAKFVTWRADSDPAFPDQYTLRVEAVTNWMGGWLRDENGKPVSSALIEIEFGMSDYAQFENPRERPGFVCTAPVTRSNPDGYWSCAVIPSNAARFPAVRARHPNFAPATIIESIPVTNLGPPHSEKFQLVWSGKSVTTMSAGITFTGRVLTQEGKPVAGAAMIHSPDTFETLRTQTGADGGFAFHGLPAGDFDVVVTTPGLAQQYFKTNLHAGLQPVEIHLQPAGLLRLRVEDDQGEPIEGATLALTGPYGMYMADFSWRAESGPDGRVEWDSAPGDRILNFAVSKSSDFAMSSQHLFKADGEEHVIRLSRAFCVQGDVTDAKTGEPISGEIKYFPGYGTDENCWYRGETRRSTNGTFRICFGEARSYRRFRIEAEGYQPFISEPLPENSVPAFHITLQPVDPTKLLRGKIVNPDGTASAGAEVALLTREHSATLGRAHFTQRPLSDRLFVNTADDGSFGFEEMAEQGAIVAVSTNGYARIELGRQQPPFDLQLQPWSRIEGVIDPSARQRPVQRVLVDDLLSMDSTGTLRLDGSSFSSSIDEEGRFSFDFVPPGKLCVYLDRGPSPDGKTPVLSNPAWVDTMPGTTAQVHVSETGVRVKGRLVLSSLVSTGTNRQKNYAILESDWPPDSRGDNQAMTAKRWISSFIDPGRLNIAEDGQFESRDPIPPGSYRLRGNYRNTRLDQSIEVPDPRSGAGSFSAPDGLNGAQVPAVNLGEVNITPAAHF